MQETWVGSMGQEDSRRREWLLTPVFLPGEFHGQLILEGYSSWGCIVRHDLVTNTQSMDLVTLHIYHLLMP